MSTSALMQLGKDEFARICDGKAPSLDSVLTLGQFVMDQLKVEGVQATALAERTVETVGEILTAAVAAAEDVPAELRELAENYSTVAGPALLVAVSGVQAVAAAVAAPEGSLAAPRWKAVLLALLGVVGGIVKGCMSARAVAVVVAAAPVAAAAAAEPEEPPHDIRLVVDPKAPPASPSDAPTPPPTPSDAPAPVEPVQEQPAE